MSTSTSNSSSSSTTKKVTKPSISSSTTRRKYKKSKVGCPQCKARKIKCDETLPYCENCKSKSIKCGYLDYSPRQLDLVRIAQWEAQGSDPATNPVKAQEYDPRLNNVIIEHKQVENKQKSSPHQHHQPHFDHSSCDHGVQTPQLDQSNGFCSPSYPTQMDSSPYIQQVNFEAGSFQQFSPQYQPLLQINMPYQQPQYQPFQYQPFQQPLPQQLNQQLPQQFNHQQVNQQQINHQQQHQQQQFNQLNIQHQFNHQPQQILLQQSQPSSFDISKQLDSFLDLTHTINFNNPAHYFTELSPISSSSSLSSVSSPTESLFDFNFFSIPLRSHKTATTNYINENGDEDMLFMLNDFQSQFKASSLNRDLFNGLMLFTTSFISNKESKLFKEDELKWFYLKIRTKVINYLLKELSNVNDSNSINLFRITNILDLSSIYNKDVDDYKKSGLTISNGQSSLIRTIYGNSLNFPNSFDYFKEISNILILKNSNQLKIQQIDNNIDALIEFYDTLKKFGEDYIIYNEYSHDYNLNHQYNDLVQFTEYSMNLLKQNDSNSSSGILKHSVKSLYQLIQYWFKIFPSNYFTLNSNSNLIEKIYYLFYSTLIKILESYLPKVKYFWGFFLDGYTIDDNSNSNVLNKSNLLIELNDDLELKKTFNYLCRVDSFFIKRKEYHLSERNIKKQQQSINELLTNKEEQIPIIPFKFKETYLQPRHYSVDLDVIYLYLMKNPTFSLPYENPHNVDLLNNMNPMTFLSNKDYDPSNYIEVNEVEEEKILKQKEVDFEFINEFIEGRQLIIYDDNNHYN